MEHNKVITDEIKEDNYKVFALLSNYLNNVRLYNQRRNGRAC